MLRRAFTTHSETPAVRFSIYAAVLLLGLMVASAPSQNALSASLPDQTVPGLTLAKADQLVRSATSGQYHALRVFKGSHGLNGVVVQPQSSSSSTAVMWITPDGAAVVAGRLFDSSAADLNEAALVSQGYRYSPAESLRHASVVAARPMLAGSAGPTLTVFIDANCSYCHLLYQQLMPYVDKHQVKVRFVMVGVIKADSIDRGVAILSARNPITALRRDQEAFDTESEEGGFPILGSPRAPAAVAAITANNALMAKSGFDGTPAFLYCSKTKGSVQQGIGIPQDLAQFLADLSSAPAQECAS
jgi:thiol:disulfide interchange protein DsbG